MAAIDESSVELQAVEKALRARAFVTQHQYTQRRLAHDRGNARERVDLLERVVATFDGAEWRGIGSNNVASPPVSLLHALREHLLADVSAVRAAALRAIRHVLLSDGLLREALTLRLPYLVAARMEAATGVWERVCALRLVVHWLALAADGRSSLPVPRIFITSLVSIAEHPEDELQSAALRTLCDAALALPRLVAECQGFFCLAEALTEPTQAALAPSLVASLLHALDDPSTRGYLTRRGHLPFRCLFAVYTGAASEATPTTAEARERQAARWGAARRAMLLMLRSTTGLFALSSDSTALPALCQLLSLRTEPRLKHALLELFADIVEEFCTQVLRSRAAQARATRFVSSAGSAHKGPVSSSLMLDYSPERYVRQLCTSEMRFSSFDSAGCSQALSAVAEAAASSAGAVSHAEAGGGSALDKGCLVSCGASQPHWKSQARDSRTLSSATVGPNFEASSPVAGRTAAGSSEYIDGAVGKAKGELEARFIHTDQDVDLLEVYAGLVLRTLFACKLPEALSDMCLNETFTPDAPDMVERGTALLADLNGGAAALLPAQVCESLQRSLYPIVSAAASFTDPQLRSRADRLLAGLSGAVAPSAEVVTFAGAALARVEGVIVGPFAETSCRPIWASECGEAGDNGQKAMPAARLRSRSTASVPWGGSGEGLGGHGRDSGALTGRRRANTAFCGRRSTSGALLSPRWNTDDSTIICNSSEPFAGGVGSEPAERRATRRAQTASPCRSKREYGRASYRASDRHVSRGRLAAILQFVQSRCGGSAHQRLLTHIQDLIRRPVVGGARAGSCDADLHGQLKQSGVVGFSNNVSKWDWRLVRDLLHGIVHDPSRMKEVLGTKFFSRLIRFFSPRYEHRFVSFPWAQDYFPLAHLGLVMFGLLVTHSSAREQLLDAPRGGDSFCADLAKLLSSELNDAPSIDPKPITSSTKRGRSCSDPAEQQSAARRHWRSRTSPEIQPFDPDDRAPSRLEQDELSSRGSSALADDSPVHSTVGFFSGFHGSSRSSAPALSTAHFLLSRERLRTGLVREYATYIGLLSSTADGIATLSSAGIYQLIRSLCAMPGKDYLSCLLLTQLHHGFEANRQLLEEALRIGSPMLQQSIAKYLSLLLLEEPIPSCPVELVFRVNLRHGERQACESVPQARLLSAYRHPMPRAGSSQSLARSQSSASIADFCSQGGRSRNNSFESGIGGVSAPPTPKYRESRDNYLAGEASAAQVAATAAAVAAATAAIAGGSGNASIDERTRSASPTDEAKASPSGSVSALNAGDMPEGSVAAEDEERWRWIVRLLAKEVSNNEPRVSSTAVDALQEACKTEDVALALLRYWPRDPRMQERWPPSLRLLLLQTEAGFDAMRCSGFLEADAHIWFNHDHYRYVDVISAMLSAAFAASQRHSMQPVASAAVVKPAKTRSLDASEAVEWINRQEEHGAGGGGRQPAGVSIPYPQTSADGAPQYSWLCSVPWRPMLQIEDVSSPEGFEDVPVDAVVERAMPHDIPWQRTCCPQQQSSLSLISAFSEMRVTALCDVTLGADGDVAFRAALAVGDLLLEETLSTFASVEDWPSVQRVEQASDGADHMYLLRKAPSGVVWTFWAGSSSGGGEAAASPSRRRGGSATNGFNAGQSMPPGNCRLVSISWPLRLLDKLGNDHKGTVLNGSGVVPPLHFCSHIARTVGGATFLRAKGYLRDHVLLPLRAILRARDGDADGPVAAEKSQAAEARAALWAAAHLGQLPYGLELMREGGVLGLVLQIATTIPRWSLRGTALYCIALMSTNPLAVEALEELGWDPASCGIRKEASPVVTGHLGVAAPEDADENRAWAPWLGTLDCHGSSCDSGLHADSLAADAWDESPRGSPPAALASHVPNGSSALNDRGEGSTGRASSSEGAAYAAFGDKHRMVLAELETLHNTVVRKKACDALAELRRQDASVFESVPLWLAAQRRVVGRRRQPLLVRRFVCELFGGALKSREALRRLDEVADCRL